MVRTQQRSSPAKGPSTSSRTTRPKREKKCRKIFDPADHVFPSLKRHKSSPSPHQHQHHLIEESFKVAKERRNSNNSVRSSSNSNQSQKVSEDCSICGLNQNSKQLLMLKCSDCSRSVHSGCINYSDKLAVRVLSMSTWQCVNCKTCAQCHDTSYDDEGMLFCDSCDLGYHMECHRPQLKTKPDGKWNCYRCTSSRENQNLKYKKVKKVLITKEDTNGKETPKKIPDPTPQVVEQLTPSEKLVKQFSAILPKDDENISFPFLNKKIDTENVPEVSNWTSKQLSDYFRQLGFNPQMCNVFIEQEIDGTALFLMEREDILSNLGLRLGPALKIYEETKKLQAKHSKSNSFASV